jgi:hypothetical protein
MDVENLEKVRAVQRGHKEDLKESLSMGRRKPCQFQYIGTTGRHMDE